MMKYLKKRRSRKVPIQNVVSTTSAGSSMEDEEMLVVASPMGSGTYSSHGIGLDSFVISPFKQRKRQQQHEQQQQHGVGGSSSGNNSLLFSHSERPLGLTPLSSCSSPSSNMSNTSDHFQPEAPRRPVPFLRPSSSFLRVADLSMDDSLHADGSPLSRSTTTTAGTASTADSSVPSLQQSHMEGQNGNPVIPNFHHVSCDPPPGVDFCPRERWVCLDDGHDASVAQHAPIAPVAIRALADFAMDTILDETMWTADTKTIKLLQHAPTAETNSTWEPTTFSQASPVPTAGSPDDVLVWSGKFHHDGYGSDLPAVRAAALIPMPAADLVDLLVDSDRVKEYNAMSQGRTDLLVLQSDMEGSVFGGVTKIMRSESRPPMLRKTLQFTSVFYARKLDGKSNYASNTTDNHEDYQLVSRAVRVSDGDNGPGVLVSEILMGCNWIRRVSDSSCLLVSVNHIRSPMVPMMIAKRIGLQAAVNFVHDVRQCCNTKGGVDSGSVEE